MIRQISLLFFLIAIFYSVSPLNSNNELQKQLYIETIESNIFPMPSNDVIQAFLKKEFDFEITQYQIELGKMLYFDPRLSMSKQISCNSCHNLSLNGTSFGAKDKILNPDYINPPTIYNLIFSKTFYKDKLDKKEKKSIQQRIVDSITNVHELNSDIKNIMEFLKLNNGYVVQFKKAYGGDAKITEDNISKSIAIFLSTLNNQNRFDDFLNGNLRALNKQELEGLETFIYRGCVNCHNGINLDGNMKTSEGKIIEVPTLRNIKNTAPYFYDGSFSELKDVIKEMGIRTNVNLSKKEINAIYTFLSSLNEKSADILIPKLP